MSAVSLYIEIHLNSDITTLMYSRRTIGSTTITVDRTRKSTRRQCGGCPSSLTTGFTTDTTGTPQTFTICNKIDNIVFHLGTKVGYFVFFRCNLENFTVFTVEKRSFDLRGMTYTSKCSSDYFLLQHVVLKVFAPTGTYLWLNEDIKFKKL